MDVAIRILSALLLLLSVGALVVAILFVRRETRIAVRRDVLRLGIAAVTVLVMNAVLDIETPSWLIATAIVVGGALGVLQGRQLAIRAEGDQMYAQRTVWGVVAWGIGTVLLQLAGVINRGALANLGLAAGFFGVATIAGLLVGRSMAINESRRAVTPTTAVLLVLALAAGSGFADTGQEHDVREISKGNVPGVTVAIRGTGTYYGDSIQLDVTNTTDRTIWVRVPAGLKLVPGNSGVQTMITAGSELIEVPPTTGPPQTGLIKAFCGEMHDGVPPASEVFTPGELVDDRTMRTVQRIQDGNFYDYNGQEAMWHLTDGADVSNNELVRQLIAPATEIPAEDAIRLSLAGLTGTALLLANALVNAGHSVDNVLSAWRAGSLRDLLDGRPNTTTEPDEYVYRDPMEVADDRERVRSVLDKLPPDQSRRDAEGQLLDRLRSEEDQRALDRIREAIGSVGPDSDISELLRDNPKVDEVLNQLPDEARRRLVDNLQRSLEQERLRNAVDAGMNVLDRERKLEVLIDARNDQNQPWRFDELLNKTDDKTLDEIGNRLDEGATPPPPDQSVSIDNLTGEEDLRIALRRNPSVREYLDTLPPDVRPQVEQQMVDNLERQIRDRTLERVREVIGPIGPDTDLDRALQDPRVVEILDRVPPSESIPLDHHIRETLVKEQVGATVEQAHQGVDLNRVERQLRAAVQEGRAGDAAQILESVTPEQAEELSNRVDVPRAARPKGGGLPPTQKPAPPPTPSGRTPPGSGGPPPTPLPPRD